MYPFNMNECPWFSTARDTNLKQSKSTDEQCVINIDENALHDAIAKINRTASSIVKSVQAQMPLY